MSTDLVKYETDTGEVVLSKEIVKNYLVSGDKNKVTDQEFELFLNLCKYQKLNPFLKEAYLVKYGQDANMIVGKDVFTKRARNNPNFKGFKAGIIVENNMGIQFRPGTFYIKKSENLVGGFCNVYIDGWEMPLEHTVELSEYSTGKSTWASKPATMIRKVALVQALREAFPEDFQGLYDGSEMGVDLPEKTNLNAAIEEVGMKHVEAQDDVIDELEDEIHLISNAQRSRMFAIAKSDENIVKAVIKRYGYESTKDIKIKDYDAICDDISTLTLIGGKSSFGEDEIEGQLELNGEA